jgi:hypothetical protein
MFFVASIAWVGTFNGEEDVYFGRIIHTPVSVDDDTETNLATTFRLDQNFPNPFNPSTTISFSLPEVSYVLLKMFNALGEEIEILVSEELSAGNYKFDWNAINLPSGIYFYTLIVESFSQTKKMILIK